MLAMNFLAQGSSFTKDILCGNSKMKVAAPVLPLIWLKPYLKEYHGGQMEIN